MERTEGDPRGRIPFYYALLVASLVLLMASGGLAYLWTLRNLFPAMEVASIPTAEQGTAPPWRRGPARRVRIVQPASNIACATERGFDLWSQTERWRGLAEAVGIATELGNARRIPARPGTIDAIVVPWVLCLAPGERRAIDRFAAAGGGVILTGAAGLADAAPRPFGAEALFVVPAGRSAPAAPLDPGRRLEIPLDSPAYTHESGDPVLWWSSWQLRPSPDPLGAWQPAAALDGGASRRAWFGFPATHAVEGSRAELDRLRSLALQWVAGDDVVALAPWPEAQRFASVVGIDTHGDEDEVLAAVEAAAALEPRATVFVYSDVVRAEGRLRTRLRASAELGSRGDRRTLFDGGTRIHQQQKLSESRAAIGGLHPRPVRGLRVPREQFDALTLHEAATAGYAYVVGDPAFDRAYPRWVSAEGLPMALVSRAAAAHDRTARQRVAPRQAQRDLRRMRALGGLHLLVLSGQGLAATSHREALAPVLRDDLRRDAWRATAGEAVRWVAQRSRVELEAAEGGALRIVNRDARPLEGLVVEVFGDDPRPARLEVPRLAAGSAARIELGGRAVAIAPARRAPDALLGRRWSAGPTASPARR